MPASTRVLKRADYETIQQYAGVNGTEDFAVVTTRAKGLMVRSIHVFARQPMTSEMTEFENTASKMKFRGNKAEVEGSQLRAALHLYNHLISRAYDVPVGLQILGEVTVEGGKIVSGKPLTRDEAIAQVPVLIKREAIRDMTAQHWSQGQIVEMEGDEEEVKGDQEED